MTGRNPLAGIEVFRRAVLAEQLDAEDLGRNPLAGIEVFGS